VKLVAVIALAAAFALSAQAAVTRTARLAVIDVTPFTVHGSQFVPHERVTVVVMVRTRHVHTVSASAAGTFTTRFTSVSVGPCTAYAVRATGDRGSTAFVKVMPECPPPAEPDALYPTDPIPKKR
jgi:hypothetical protein